MELADPSFWNDMSYWAGGIIAAFIQLPHKE